MLTSPDVNLGPGDEWPDIHLLEPRYDALKLHEVTVALRAGLPADGATHVENTDDSQVWRLARAREPLGVLALRLSTPTEEREDERTSLEGMLYRLSALERGQGLASFEQVVTYRRQDEAIATRWCEGATLGRLPVDAVAGITNEELVAVGDDIETAAKRLLCLDGSVENFLYKPGCFTVIDYTLAIGTEYADQLSAASEWRQFIGTFGEAGTDTRDPSLRREWRRVMRMGIQLLKSRYPREADRESARLTYVYGQFLQET